MIRNGSRLASCLVPLLLAACVEGEPPEDLQAASSPLVQSPSGSTLAATVMLQSSDGTMCTGSVLTDHWILTAAHCLNAPSTATLTVSAADVTGSPTISVYSGRVERFKHPSWGGDTDTSVSYDVGLIRLLDAPVANFSRRAYLFADTVGHPWYGSYRMYAWYEGFGDGSPETGSSSCDSSTLTWGILRRHNQVSLDGSDSTTVISSNRRICAGDSGGPWLLDLYDTSWKMVQFAVTHGHNWGGIVGGNILSVYDTAGALPKALPWIESMIKQAYTLQITSGVATGYAYRTYKEIPTSTVGVFISGYGAVSASPTPISGSCTSAACTYKFSPGTAVTLTAIPADGSMFSSWTGCPSPSGNRCSVVLNTNLSMSVKFVTDPGCTIDPVCQNACMQECIANREGNCTATCNIDCSTCP